MTARRLVPALALAGGLLLGGLAAPAATAAPAAPAAPAAAAGSIFGPCNALQAYDYRWFGRLLYECVYISGLGGWYWVRVTFPGCAPALAPGGRVARC